LADAIDYYFRDKSLVSHNIESFNKFIEKGMQRVIDEVGEITPDILPDNVRNLKIKFGKVSVEKPFLREADGTRRRITPMEARLRNVTYEAPIMLEMRMIKDDVEGEKRVVDVGNMPIMLRSKYCYLTGKTREEIVKMDEDPDDPGGYFIINGTERVVVIVEDLAPNKIFVNSTSTGPYPFSAKIFSEDGQYRIPHAVEKAKSGEMFVTFTRVKKIPFVVLMKALGLTRDKDIMDAVTKDDQLQSDIFINLYQAEEVNDQKDALAYIGKKMGISNEERQIERAEEMVDRFLFPHIGHDESTRLMKAYFLGKVVKRLLLVSYGELPQDDKDHYANKRLRLTGDMMETLFRFSFRMLTGDMKYNFERLVKRGKIPNLPSVTRSQLLTSRVRSALATGEWIGSRHGVSQHIDRLNHFAMTSHLRRVVSLLTASRENFEARDLHPTHWGKLCTSETPEGPAVGLRKNLAVTCEISTESDVDEEALLKELSKNGLDRVG
jgi:DNA-directed RNA polymerase beta subunit